MKFKLEKRELLYAFIGIIVILIWFLWIKNLIAPYLINVFPFLAMLIYNLGTFLGLILISSILDSRKVRIKASLIAFMVLLGEDIIMAPYIVGSNGITNKVVEFWNVSSDAGVASLWGLLLPITWIWFFTYIITPILFIFIIPIIVASPKTILSIFK